VFVPRIGRKWAMVASSLLMALSLFLFAAVNTQASNIGLNAMEYFFQSMFNAVLYGWTPEAFPAPVRGTAAGVASFWGRLFSIWTPLVAAHILERSLNGPLFMAGAGVLVCTVAILFLPSRSFDAKHLLGK
jgi:MFS family permease